VIFNADCYEQVFSKPRKKSEYAAFAFFSKTTTRICAKFFFKV